MGSDAHPVDGRRRIGSLSPGGAVEPVPDATVVTLRAGETSSHYRILAKLGEGGMGVVYKAEDTKLRRMVALKFLPPEAATDRERFLREAQAAAALNHPNICTIYEIDDENNFLALEFIDGPTVHDKITARPLPLEEALDIAIQACQGLQAAHEKCVIHRDTKSANLMLTPQGQVKITDFGLARMGDRTRLTQTGLSLGTPAYMSPEQARGQATDRRTDIWSLSVVLYEMVAGRLPFLGDSEQAMSYSILHAEPEPLTALRAGIPIDLDRILAKTLAKDPMARYAHVDDLIVDLTAVRRRLRGASLVRALVGGASLSHAACRPRCAGGTGDGGRHSRHPRRAPVAGPRPLEARRHLLRHGAPGQHHAGRVHCGFARR